MLLQADLLGFLDIPVTSILSTGWKRVIQLQPSGLPMRSYASDLWLWLWGKMVAKTDLLRLFGSRPRSLRQPCAPASFGADPAPDAGRPTDWLSLVLGLASLGQRSTAA